MVHLRLVFLKSLQDRADRPDENAGVPVKIPALKKDLSHLAVRFLGERLHLVKFTPAFL
jgi:hypothetical protein